MMTERSVFLSLLAIDDSAEREAYLEEACAGQPTLRAQVEQLLQAHADPGAFMERPASVVLSGPEQLGERPGDVIGPYKLLEQIGEGGFGMVFMAEQLHPVRRKVALKILKPGMDTRQVVARFEAERQALALMDHENIAHVLEANATESGRPYFVMELVRGVPITDYCHEAVLPVRGRLELFLSVCRAVQHAHQKGVIHRDIKPGNVLVTLHDGVPVVKVIDFGIAKAMGQQLTEKTLFTNFAQMMGTPLYMSPEQAEMSGLDTDTRTDIYSLGVLLYELLTGTTPFDKERLRGAGYDEMRRIIREEEPPRPSDRVTTVTQAATVSGQPHGDPRRLRQLIRRELDWVVMKCLEKDRNRRYETASALVEDLERYLRDEPVQACPPSGLYRIRKFARRNKVAFGIGVAAATATVIGVASLAAGYSWVKRERDAKVVALAEKEAALASAQANFARAEEQRLAANESSWQARQAVDEFFTHVSESTLLDVPGLQPLRKELLEAALKYHQVFLQRRTADPELRAELAASYFRVAQIYNVLDQNEDAVRAMREGLALADQLVHEYPDRPELARRLGGFYKGGRIFHRGTRPPADPRAAAASLEQARTLWDGFVRANPDAAELQNDLAGIYAYLGELQMVFSQHAGALVSFEKAAELLQVLARQHPTVADYRADLADCLDRRGDLLRRAGKVDEAERSYQHALNLWQELAAGYPARPAYRMEMANAYNSIGRRLTAIRQYPEADAALLRAQGILGQLVKDFPRVPAYRESFGVAYSDLGSSLRRQGRLQESIAAYRQALAHFDHLAPEFPNAPRYRERQSRCCDLLSLLLLAAGETEEADRLHRRAVTIEESLMLDFPGVEEYANEFGWMVIVWPTPASRETARAVEIASNAVTRPETAGRFWKILGGAEYRAGHWDAARAALEKALAGGGTKTPWFFLAMVHQRLGEHEKAQNHLDQAIRWMEQSRPHDERLLRLRAEATQLLGRPDPGPATGRAHGEEKRPPPE